MEISNFAFIVTNDCNFNCSYCYQKKEKKYMKNATIEKAVAFFYPFLKEREGEIYVVFYGGEPLLAFDAIKHAVFLIQDKNKEEKKKFEFSLTTNGSLITDKNLEFFNLHRFSIMLSFDGMTQDIARKPGSLEPTRELIQRIQRYPGIKFSTNSVFTPATIAHFSDSLQYIITSGGNKIEYSLSTIEPWDLAALDILKEELKRLTDFLLLYYREKGIIPVTYFRPREGNPKQGFFCSGGRDRMAVCPDENLWGCYLFHDFLRDKQESNDYCNYSFGNLDDFMENHDTIYPRILDNYSVLSQDCFFTEKQFCFLCKEKDHCVVCPISAAYSTSFIGKIPPWICCIEKMQKKEKERFLREIP